MKKILIMIFTFFLLSGCSFNTKSFDFENLEKQVDEVTSDTLDLNDVVINVEKDIDYDKMEYKKEETLDEIGIEMEDIDDYVIRSSTNESDNYAMYMVFKPKEDKKEEIKNKIKAYFDKLIEEEKNSKNRNLLVNRVEEEYLGYLIYVVGKSSENTLKKITESKAKVFSTLINVGKSGIKDLELANDNDFDKYIIKMSGKLDKVNAYFIIKPKENKDLDIKEDISNYFKMQEEKFKDNPTELQILKNRLETEINGCLVYIVSSDNDKVLKVIQEGLK